MFREFETRCTRCQFKYLLEEGHERIRKGSLKGLHKAFFLPDGFYVVQGPHKSGPFCTGQLGGRSE